MHILEANKYYFMNRGAERAMLGLESLLRDHGHRVTPFAMQDPRSIATEWDKYFVSPVDMSAAPLSRQGLRTAGRLLYSFEARRKFGALLDETDPSLVHCHNIYHQLSPSILIEAWKRAIPVVLTAHDYNFIAPNYMLWHDGAPCSHTLPDRYWRAVTNRCVRGSFLASALEAASFRLHDALRLWGAVDTIIAPSRFVIAKFGEFGIGNERLAHVPHFVDTAGVTPTYDGGRYALYVGALAPEKGVDVLLRAAAHLPHAQFRIVGSGSEEGRLRAMASALGLRNVEFRGARSGAELVAEYASARFVVVPSVWYEVFGLVCLEAYAHGKPVIASQIGALPEVVRPGETGLLAAAGDDVDLARAIDVLWHDPRGTAGLGRAGRRLAETEYTPELHYDRTIEVYRAAMRRAP